MDSGALTPATASAPPDRSPRGPESMLSSRWRGRPRLHEGPLRCIAWPEGIIDTAAADRVGSPLSPSGARSRAPCLPCFAPGQPHRQDPTTPFAFIDPAATATAQPLAYAGRLLSSPPRGRGRMCRSPSARRPALRDPPASYCGVAAISRPSGLSLRWACIAFRGRSTPSAFRRQRPNVAYRWRP